MDEEATLTTEQILEATPLGVEPDPRRRGQPTTLGDRHRLVGGHPRRDYVTGQVVGDIDPPPGGGGCEGGDEKALSSQE
jgi:hypothetical protein